MDREIIKKALVDALILRQETKNHDISGTLRDQLVAAAMPAFIDWEADRAEESVTDTDEEFARRLMAVIKKLEVHADSAGYVYAHPKFMGNDAWWPPSR
jgi:hypothetical protein